MIECIHRGGHRGRGTCSPCNWIRLEKPKINLTSIETTRRLANA